MPKRCIAGLRKVASSQALRQHFLLGLSPLRSANEGSATPGHQRPGGAAQRPPAHSRVQEGQKVARRHRHHRTGAKRWRRTLDGLIQRSHRLLQQGQAGGPGARALRRAHPRGQRPGCRHLYRAHRRVRTRRPPRPGLCPLRPVGARAVPPLVKGRRAALAPRCGLPGGAMAPGGLPEPFGPPARLARPETRRTRPARTPARRAPEAGGPLSWPRLRWR